MRRLLFLLLLLPAGLCAQLLPTKVARTAPVLTQGQSAQIWADSSGHLHIKCDSGCSAMSLTGLSADTLGYLWHVIDSLNLRYGNKHLGAVAIDTTKGCLATANGCDLHVYVDTLGHVRDSLNASVNVKNLPSVTVGSPLLNAKVSGADSVWNSLTVGAMPAVDSTQLRTGTHHAARVAIDSGVGLVYATKTQPAITNNTYTQLPIDTAGRLRVKVDTSVALNVTVPATDSLNLRAQKSGNELYMKCDSGCGSGGGGGNPTGGYLNGIGKDTIAAPLLNGKVAVADSITSVPLTAGGYIGLDSIIAGHCLASPNGCDLHAYVDTLGHVRDSLNASVNVKNLPSVTVGSPLLNAKVSGADSVWNSLTVGTVSTVTKVTRSGDSIYFSVHLPDSAITSTAHMGRTAIDSLVGGTLISRANPSYTSSSGYEPISADTNGRQRVRLDSMSGCPTENYPSNCPLHVVADSSHVGYPPGDSLQRSDSLIIADTVYRRAADTCVTSFGGKSVADSASFPAVSGKYIYLTGLSLAVCDTLAVTGTTYLTITTSNLRGLTFETGNAQTVGTCTPIQTPQISNGSPVRSTASNTLTQVKIPAAGTGAYGYISMCGYYHAMRMLLDPNEYAMRVEPAREPRPKPPTFDVWRDAA